MTEEQFNNIAYNYRSWPSHDPKGVSERYEELWSLFRQQQAEIEVLKAEKIRAYNNGYEDGRKPNTDSNEPVAWMSPDGRFSTTEGKLFYIPLYTHPTKTLTDEEINLLAKAYSTLDGQFNAPAFARAILRKAQQP